MAIYHIKTRIDEKARDFSPLAGWKYD